METIELSATLRGETGKKTKHLVRKGIVPAVIYGNKETPINIKVDGLVFNRVYRKAGESTLIHLQLEGKETVPALIYDIQHEPVTDQVIHVDFYRVDMKKKLHTKIPIKIVGVAPAVKDHGGIMVKNREELQVRCLPGALVHEIEVDVSKLINFHDAVHVRDLIAPEGIEFLDIGETPVILIAMPKVEVVAPTEGAPGVADVKIVGKEDEPATPAEEVKGKDAKK